MIRQELLGAPDDFDITTIVARDLLDVVEPGGRLELVHLGVIVREQDMDDALDRGSNRKRDHIVGRVGQAVIEETPEVVDPNRGTSIKDELRAHFELVIGADSIIWAIILAELPVLVVQHVVHFQECDGEARVDPDERVGHDDLRFCYRWYTRYGLIRQEQLHLS